MDRADTQLWHGWRTHGDAHAFEALVRPHLRFATDFARRMGCRPDQADDVVQEALVRLAQEDSERPVEVGLRAWLGRTVSLQTRMLKRSEGRRAKRERTHGRPASRLEVSAPRTPEVDRALEALAAGPRQAVILRYRHDLEYREIARILDISENAARLRVHKAMRELRERLGKNAGPVVAALPLLPGGERSGIVKAALSSTGASSGTGILLGALAVKNILLAAAVLMLGGAAVFLAAGRDDVPATPSPGPTGSSARGPMSRDAAEAPSLAPVSRRPEVPAPPQATTPAPVPSGDAAAVLRRLLASGARLSYAARGDFEGTRHRVRWVKQGDEIPEGLPTAIWLGDEGLDDLLARDDLLRKLHYLSADGKVFDDAALERVARHADLLVLRLNRAAVTDEGLRAISRLPSLRALTLKHGAVGDAGMRHVGGLSNLVWLDVRDTHVSDAGLEHLSGLARLQRFEFGGTSVTDAGLRHLRAARLRTLNLESTRISGAGVRELDLSELVEVEADEAGSIGDALLESLRGASALEVLVLKETGVTDAGLVHLKTMPSLKELDLNDTHVTDEGLRVLAELPKLEELSLRQTSVTDDVVDVLLQIEKLEKVNLSGTRVTRAGITRLREARPELDIREP